MGIIAIKAMAKGPWAPDADRSRYPKLWYEPLTAKDDIKMGLRFTLSHPVTTALPPGDADLFNIALSLRNQLKPLSNKEVELIKTRALDGNLLFKYPLV